MPGPRAGREVAEAVRRGTIGLGVSGLPILGDLGPPSLRQPGSHPVLLQVALVQARGPGKVWGNTVGSLVVWRRRVGQRLRHPGTHCPTGGQVVFAQALCRGGCSCDCDPSCVATQSYTTMNTKEEKKTSHFFTQTTCSASNFVALWEHTETRALRPAWSCR